MVKLGPRIGCRGGLVASAAATSIAAATAAAHKIGSSTTTAFWRRSGRHRWTWPARASASPGPVKRDAQALGVARRHVVTRRRQRRVRRRAGHAPAGCERFRSGQKFGCRAARRNASKPARGPERGGLLCCTFWALRAPGCLCTQKLDISDAGETTKVERRRPPVHGAPRTRGGRFAFGLASIRAGRPPPRHQTRGYWDLRPQCNRVCGKHRCPGVDVRENASNRLTTT